MQNEPTDDWIKLYERKLKCVASIRRCFHSAVHDWTPHSPNFPTWFHVSIPVSDCHTKDSPLVGHLLKMPKGHLDAFLTESKAMKFKTTNSTTCTLCPSSVPTHKMAYQLVWCTSDKCKELASLKPCAWRGRIDTCNESGATSLSELNEHVTTAMSPKANKLTRPMRSFTRDMALRAMKPAEIRNAIIETLDLNSETAPKLVDIQNCVSNYWRTHTSNSDLLETLTGLAQRFQFSPATTKDDPISLGYERDVHGVPDLGEENR